MNRVILALAATLATVSLGFAQTYRDSSGTVVPGFAPLVGCTASGNCAGPASASTPLPVAPAPSSAASSAMSHGVTPAMASSLVLKASAGNLYSVNATAITGGSAGYLVVVNATSAPTNGSAITPLDFCYFNGVGGCSLSHGAIPINYSTGIVALITTAVNPYTYTSGTDTAAISGDFQ